MRDWKADGCRWKSGSWREWPKNNDLFKKKYFSCINTDGEASVTHKTFAGEASIDSPRDLTQVKHYHQKFLQQKHSTNDELLHLILSNELKDYIRTYQIQPQLSVVLIHTVGENLFGQLLELTTKPMPLYYDTTFNIGDYYVSVSLFKLHRDVILLILFLDFNLFKRSVY
ncbi:unnamed protein product [Didymodactylos carnosus]|uniref:Uncharacterized protein n=1 Tax=Didymodactylos carnosus TaxID=1234261 RepID=A0A816B9F7_9BILA|nr:unnamed protein product [Didymodactylos carnosus]CAF4486054.1 unnamed protein product [Didymodactylos carnosus]